MKRVVTLKELQNGMALLFIEKPPLGGDLKHSSPAQ